MQIDDAAVSEDAPWSSKRIIDMFCPPLEESGNPVMCYPVAGYPLGVKVSWEPTQEGSGDPSPDNIRPIKGRDSVTITRQKDNQVITLTLPETVYGGEVDAVSGEGHRMWETVTLDGTENWEEATSVQIPYFRANVLHLGAVTLASLAAKCTAFPLADISGNNNNNGFNGWNAALYIRWASLSTVDALKSYLASKYAAGTPVQICYKLAEPVPFTAAGAQPIFPLAGANTLLTDADNVSVSGRADLIHIIKKIQENYKGE